MSSTLANPPLVALHEAMRIAIEMLGRKFVQLGVLERFHLMNEAGVNIHAFAGVEDELLNLGIGRFLDRNAQAARAQEKGFGFELMEMQRASLALVDFQNFAAIKFVVGEPD